MENIFDINLQNKVLSLMLKDKNFMARTWHLIKPYYFDSTVLVDLCRIILSHYEKYSQQISIEALFTEIGPAAEEHAKTAVMLYKDTLIDREYVKSKVLQFIAFQEYRNATERTIEALKKGELDDVKKFWEKAFKVGDGHQPGMFYFDPAEIDKRLQPDESKRVPTGMAELDFVIQGGLGNGELGIILAPPGVGKSKALVVIGCGALRLRKKVAHFSMEMRKEKVGLRYDRNLTGKNIRALREEPEEVKKFLEQFNKNLHANLYIKDWPTRTCTIDMMKAELDFMSAQDFYPDVVIVDYAAIMKPRHIREGRHQEIEETNEDLRGLAGELDVPVWSAAQTKSSALGKAIVDIDDFGESFAQSKVAELILAYCQTDKEYEANEMRWFVAKQRDEKKHQVLRYSVRDEVMRMMYLGEQ